MSKPITRAISVLRLLRRLDVVPAKYVAEVDSTIAGLKIADARTRLDPSKRKRQPAKKASAAQRPRRASVSEYAEMVDADQGGVRRRVKSAKRPAKKAARARR